MKKIFFFLALASFLESCSHAQQPSFDIMYYTAPKNWTKQASASSIQFTTEDKTKGTYCIITVLMSIPGTADSKTNFDAAWETVVKEMVKVSSAPEMQPVANENGWEAQTGYAPFESDGTKGVVLLTTSTGFGKMMNIIIMTNSDVYEKDMNTFMESVSFRKITDNTNTQKITTGTSNVINNGYTFNTTNFDDGWNSTVNDDYVLSTKGNIKVYLSFIEKFNASEFAGTGKEARYHYWNTWVGKYFTTGDIKAQTASALSDYSENYIEGWVNDKQTGERRYIGMVLNIIAYTGTLSIIVASAPDAAQLRQQFPKADLKYPNDLLSMYSYNKFAVGKNDLPGTWSSNGGGTVSWYSTTTGEYAGATGAALSDRFIFNANGTYSSEHKGGYGVVGNMNTYQQKYNGAYTVSNWQVTASKRWDGKTEQFSAWFEVVRGGRVLHLDAGAGKSYTLYKEK